MSDSRLVTDSDHKAYQGLAVAVGNALDRWSQIELGVSNTFQIMSGIPKATVAHAAMAAIISFEARLQVCAAIFRLSDQPDWMKAYWTNLQGRIIKLSKKRNAIAHYSIVKMTPVNGEPFWKLVPFFSLGQIANAGSKANALKTHDVASIDELKESFNKMTDEILWLNHEISRHRGLLGANPKPEPDQARRIRMEAVQTLEGKQPPPRSSQG